jgi:hydroxymethylpyrimidine/phosphomethylpyrimidine kinase
LTQAPARLLVIAGSDSSGGAGIEADIKTATAFGVYAMTAITAVTVQDTTGIHAVHAIPPSIVQAQIAHVLADIGADAIKIGMLGTLPMVEAVANALSQRARGIPLILDPVLASTSGTPLLARDGIDALKCRLVSRATVVTPNIPEAEHLTGMRIASREDAAAAAKALQALGAAAVLIKGGHAEGDVIEDVLVAAEAVETFRSPRLATPHTHGTGCTLATAIACSLAQKGSLHDAVVRAHDYVQRAIATAPGLGRGRGPLNHMHGLNG